MPIIAWPMLLCSANREDLLSIRFPATLQNVNIELPFTQSTISDEFTNKLSVAQFDVAYSPLPRQRSLCRHIESRSEN